MLSARSLAFALVATVCCGAEKPGPRSFTVQASGSDSQEQVIALTGVRMPSDVIGFRVYLNPPAGKPLSPESPASVGSLFASHREPGGDAAGDFVLRLPNKVSGEARVVVDPISSAGASPVGQITIKKVEIKPLSKVNGVIEDDKR